MSAVLEMLLILVSTFTLWYVIRKIRKSQMMVADASYWVIFSIILIIIAVFPGIVTSIAEVLGIMSPVNGVFLAIIFLLLLKLFTLSIKVSKMENKLSELAEEIALKEKEKDK